MRFVLVVVAVMMLTACDGGSSHSAAAKRTPESVEATPENKPTPVPKVIRCYTDANGHREASISLTNHTPGASTFVVDVSFVNRKSNARLAQGSAQFFNVQSGGAGIAEVAGGTDNGSSFACHVGQIRFFPAT